MQLCYSPARSASATLHVRDVAAMFIASPPLQRRRSLIRHRACCRGQALASPYVNVMERCRASGLRKLKRFGRVADPTRAPLYRKYGAKVSYLAMASCRDAYSGPSNDIASVFQVLGPRTRWQGR